MKVKFFEHDHAGEIQLTPETVEEVTALARFAKNAKAEKPSIYFSFSKEPYLNLYMKKIDKTKQKKFNNELLKAFLQHSIVE